MKSLFFTLRIGFAWAFLLLFAMMLVAGAIGERRATYVAPFALIALAVVIVRAYSHVRRVRFLADNPGAATFGSRHRRRIELPFPAAETFDMVDAAIRELPYVDSVESVRDSLQVHARVKRIDPYLSGKQGRRLAFGPAGARRNLVHATIAPGNGTGSLTLICEPEGGAWVDWFHVDDGTNFENAEAITRAISRRIAERRKGEEAVARETATDKELAVAKLSLLHAQVEPHFLYNTLASAQLLTRSDPPKADRMLGNLITYLRGSMPRTGNAMSTLGAELERVQAYLEILRIRMGDRLDVRIEVPEPLQATPLPSMMLQTLVENAIKHGLEPLPGGGTIWILARAAQGRVSLTVADDGRGFSEDGGGTGIGLKNVRERLRLVYDGAASFSIAANFPKGVAATIVVPA
ncbi:MAG: histidine kinase [Betaproteobacteria bacterium]|nr:histidine kinase [Betaproteobacteria bacterium]MBK9608212.1 histidine kinase [Betaproteobacteria bacterium]